MTIKANTIHSKERRDEMTFEQDYFENRKYPLKEKLVRRHVLAVLQWASKAGGDNLLKGEGRRALDVGSAYGYTSNVLT